ncbi:MAG: serine hydrolase [Candidatus Rokuibacteriota bacterium]
MTKQFTASGVMLLVQDGRVRLDDPVKTYLPQRAHELGRHHHPKPAHPHLGARPRPARWVSPHRRGRTLTPARCWGGSSKCSRSSSLNRGCCSASTSPVRGRWPD